MSIAEEKALLEERIKNLVNEFLDKHSYAVMKVKVTPPKYVRNNNNFDEQTHNPTRVRVEVKI